MSVRGTEPIVPHRRPPRGIEAVRIDRMEPGTALALQASMPTRKMAGFWCTCACPCARLNGKHGAWSVLSRSTCAAPATVSKRHASQCMATGLSITTMQFAWEGGPALLASPDTGQDRWKRANGDFRGAPGLPAWAVPSAVSPFQLLFNPVCGEADRLPFSVCIHDLHRFQPGCATGLCLRFHRRRVCRHGSPGTGKTRPQHRTNSR